MLLRALKEAARSFSSRNHVGREYPLEFEHKLGQLHGRAPLDRHLEYLFQDARIGNQSFVKVHGDCLARTGTVLSAASVFQRYQTRLALVNYFLASLPVAGARAE